MADTAPDPRVRGSVISLAGGSLRRANCRKCGESCAWAKSKAGRWYLCSLFPAMNDSGADRAAPWVPHKCRDREEARTSKEAWVYLAAANYRAGDAGLAMANDLLRGHPNTYEDMVQVLFKVRSVFGLDDATMTTIRENLTVAWSR